MNWELLLYNLFGALPPTIVAVLAWWASSAAGRGVDRVHVIVNSQRAVMMKEIDALKDEIRDAKYELRELRRAAQDPPIEGV